MARTTTRVSIATLLALAGLSIAGKNSFSINDDVLAFPQYEVGFPNEYIFEADAQQRLQYSRELQTQRSKRLLNGAHQQQSLLQRKDVEQYGTELAPDMSDSIETYEEMLLGGQRFLCGIPHVASNNETDQTNDASSEEERELARAKARGLELLSGLRETCLYYIAGWWSYSFCYMNEIRQFHALPPGNGVPVYPPVEDRSAKAYVLGKFLPEQENERIEGVPSTDLAELQSTGDSRYLVQRLGHGTKCDLTDKRRQIEVQFHCHPQFTDRIAYIEETTTCNYLMVIYTPRLCNDVAFQPVRQDDANQIVCKQIIKPEELPEWEGVLARAKAEEQEELRSQQEKEAYPVIADIRVGGRALMDKDGNAFDTGQLAAVAGREQVEIVASKKDGQVKKLTKQDYEKMGMTPDELEELKQKLERLSEGKLWKLELVTVNGETSLRGLLDDEGEDEGEGEERENQNASGEGVGPAAPNAGGQMPVHEEL